MDKFINFITNNYLILDIISLILILSLIGYFVNKNKEKAKVFKINDESNINLIEDIPIDKNISLQEIVNENKSINNNNL